MKQELEDEVENEQLSTFNKHLKVMYILIILDDNIVGSSASKSHTHKQKWEDKLDKRLRSTRVQRTCSRTEAMELPAPSAVASRGLHTGYAPAEFCLMHTA